MRFDFDTGRVILDFSLNFRRTNTHFRWRDQCHTQRPSFVWPIPGKIQADASRAKSIPITALARGFDLSVQGQGKKSPRKIGDTKTVPGLDCYMSSAFPMLEHQSKDYQVENHLIDDSQYWVRRGGLGWNDLSEAVDRTEGPLWLDEGGSYYGLHDKVPLAEAAKLNGSLLLVEPTDLTIRVGIEGGIHSPAKRRVRADFRLGDTEYRLSVTDPVVEQDYLQRNNGTYGVDEALLCISLGEPFHGDAYKLIAAVITPH